MAWFGPFEVRPRLAVGVSGGADSLALMLSAASWATERSGEAVALVVDHGLRAESLAEARWVEGRLGAFDIRADILTWRRDAPPGPGLQDHARRARRDLMLSWCRERGVLHLLLGHHRSDQAETIVMRQQRVATGDGVAGMSGIVETADARLLRPLLLCEPGDLRQRLRAAGQTWVEDPSNRDNRFERVRVRSRLPDDVSGILDDGAHAARARRVRDDRAACILAATVRCHPWGVLEATIGEWLSEPQAVLADVLGRVVRTISGNEYRPRTRALTALSGRVVEPGFRGATLGGCRLSVRRGRLYIFREYAAIQAPCSLKPGQTVVWDRRFRIALGPAGTDGEYRVGALGREGCAAVRDWPGLGHLDAWPAEARRGLPALRWNDTVVSVAGLTRTGLAGHPSRTIDMKIRPTNPEPLTNPRFFIASGSE